MEVKCISKIRDNTGKIIGYTIQDQQGKTISVKAQALKLAIKQGKVEVINLTLTSDNRLIDKAVDAKKSKANTKNKLDINSILNMANTSGQLVTELPTHCKKPCYLISNQYETHHIVVIPDNVTELNHVKEEGLTPTVDSAFTDCIKNIHGALKIIGGSNLKSTYAMFKDCEAQTIDLSSFDTSSVTDMSKMFENCRAESIDLSSLDTHNVTNMWSMFAYCWAEHLDLSSFNTSNVRNMQAMFAGCKAKDLKLSAFNTRNVTNMFCMFLNCEAQTIDLASFDTSKVADMGAMFKSCVTQVLDLSSFNTRHVKDMSSMFFRCKAKTIDLSSFSVSQETDVDRMFDACKAQVKATSSRILEAYNDR